MRIETAKDIANGTGALAGSSGMITIGMAYLNANAIGIGALCSIISLIVYIFFQLIYYRKLTLADENKAYIEIMQNKVGELESTIESMDKDK